LPPNQFRSGFVPEASDGAKLSLKRLRDGTWQLFYETSSGAIDIAKNINSDFEAPTKPILLAEGKPGSDELVTYPLNTTATSTGFLERRYGRIEAISLVGFNLMDIEDEDFEGFFEQLPAGFKKSPYFGFGLNYDLRDIVYAIEEIGSVSGIKILRKLTGKDPDISGDSYLISAKKFDEVRRAIRRIHDKALEVASEDKDSFSNNALLTALDPLRYPIKRRSYQKDAVSIAIGRGPERDEGLSEADRDAVAAATKRSAGALRRERPEALLELNREIEIVTLDDLIDRMKLLLTRNHNENAWQAFFRENPFIIRLAFSIPVMVIGDQFYVGGQRFDGGGEKISDFALKTAATGNISLVEIKTPQTDLLETRPYRGGVYAPSKELSGAVNQVLDQAYQLQRTIDGKKANSRAYDLETYAVQGLVIAGRNLVDEEKKKSFELFRNSQKSVHVVTFDELLTKLELLRELLGPPSSLDPDIEVDLEAGESEN
jgi:hypothetical protein